MGDLNRVTLSDAGFPLFNQAGTPAPSPASHPSDAPSSAPAGSALAPEAPPVGVQNLSTVEQQLCCFCHQPRTPVAVPIRDRTGALKSTRYWHRPCDCELAVEARAQMAAEDARIKREREAYDARVVRLQAGSDDLERALRLDWTLDTFDPARLDPLPDGGHPYDEAVAWMRAAMKYTPATWDGYTPPGAHAVYNDPACPAAAVLFQGPRGRGKSHLANALGLWAQQHGHACRPAVNRVVRSINETRFLSLYWSDLGGQARLIERLASRPWLLIVDDIGQRPKGSDGVREAYYALINARYEAQGWTIFTSNYSLDELVERRIITEYAQSRMAQMIRLLPIEFNSAHDQRMVA